MLKHLRSLFGVLRVIPFQLMSFGLAREGVIPKIARQMCYKMAKNHISLIHFNIIFSDKGHNGQNKITHLNVSKFATQVKWLPTWVSHHRRINSLHAIFFSCLIIFGMTWKFFATRRSKVKAMLHSCKAFVEATLCTWMGQSYTCAPSTCVVHHQPALCTIVHKGDLSFGLNLEKTPRNVK